MKKIQKAYLAKGRNTEHLAFHDKVLAALTAETAAGLNIGPQRAAYAALFRSEETIFKNRNDEELTKTVREKDKARDSIFTHLRLVVEAYKLSPEPELKAAAEQLSHIIRPYRKANVTAYRENTALINNLLGKLKSTDYAASLEALGMTHTVALLRKANEEFDAVNTERADRRLVRDTSEKMNRIRRQVDEAYHTVAEALDSLYGANELVHHDEQTGQTLSTLIDRINSEVHAFQRSLAQRGIGRKAKTTAAGGTMYE